MPVLQLQTLLDQFHVTPIRDRVMDRTNQHKAMCSELAALPAGSSDLVSRLVVIFSAKYNHRPPLMDKRNASTRANPKYLEEGERESTHVAMRFWDDEATVIMECRKVGVSALQLGSYFQFVVDKSFPRSRNVRVAIESIPNTSFEDALQGIDRCTIAAVYIPVREFTQGFAQFAGYPFRESQENVQLLFKASRGRNIKNLAMQIWRRMGGHSGQITGLRVIGKSEAGDSIILDTDLVRRVDHLDVDLNEVTGQVNSSQLFDKLYDLLPSRKP